MRRDDDVVVDIHTVTVTGTRSTGHHPVDVYEEFFERYIRPFADQDTHCYLGGAVGIDVLALDWLGGRTPSVITVVVPCTVADQPDEAADSIMTWHHRGRLAEVVELEAPRLDASAYRTRNRWMVDRSGFVIGFPHGREPASGTWDTLHYAAEQEKPRLVVPV